MDAAQEPGRVVALVASAGGIEPIFQILQALPPDLDAAVIVLVHQQPDRLSHLTEILARETPWPVRTAEDGARLTRGRVLVIGPGQHLLVTPDLSVMTILAGRVPPARPSADLLLATLATAMGDRAIAVVLSGMGHDGATGATAIHRCGGVVIATDESSSKFFSMPKATIERDHAVDVVLGVGEVAGAVAAFVSGEELRPAGA